jgi:hypothetical protein
MSVSQDSTICRLTTLHLTTWNLTKKIVAASYPGVCVPEFCDRKSGTCPTIGNIDTGICTGSCLPNGTCDYQVDRGGQCCDYNVRRFSVIK